MISALVKCVIVAKTRRKRLTLPLDLTPIQVEEATAVFHQALMPHQVWSGPLPVCLAEHHQGKVRRLRLVLATLSHLTKAEITSLQYGPRLPGGTTEHGLVYGYLDARAGC